MKYFYINKLVIFPILFGVVKSFMIATYPAQSKGRTNYSVKPDSMLENSVNSLPDLSSLTDSPLSATILDDDKKIFVEEELIEESDYESDPYSDMLDMSAVISEKVRDRKSSKMLIR